MNRSDPKWYQVNDIGQVDTPALLIYEERVVHNIKTAINMVGSPDKLRPHVKTHKSSEVSKLMLEHGITKFKCATIAEAEMLAQTGAEDVLIAYQPNYIKAQRVIKLINAFPKTEFSILIDNSETSEMLNTLFHDHDKIARIYIDLDVGMHRTGVAPHSAFNLVNSCQTMSHIQVLGLHAYDGHIRDVDFVARKAKCDQAFEEVTKLKGDLKKKLDIDSTIVVGGSPCFSIHCKREEVECSPGTFVYWDHGYQSICKEQDFQIAALVISRVISHPADNTICLDLGHKSIAAENPFPRVFFFELDSWEAIGQSEEHLVMRSEIDDQPSIETMFYGVPKHICPTVALYNQVSIIRNGRVDTVWDITARGRRISI